MTSVLPDEENSNVTRLKRKAHAGLKKQCSDESRTFLTFSRENLSMSSCSELEQGFNRSSSSRGYRCCSCLCKKQTLLSCAALILALSCAVLELWKLRKVMANARDIEAISRDVEELKHRFLEKDLLDELRAFEEQLYGDGTNNNDNDSSLDSNADYDSSYDDSTSSQPSTITPSPLVDVTTTTTRPCTNKDLEDVLAVLRRAEAEQNVRQRERLLEEERQKELRRMSVEHRIDGKKKRDVNYRT